MDEDKKKEQEEADEKKKIEADKAATSKRGKLKKFYQKRPGDRSDKFYIDHYTEQIKNALINTVVAEDRSENEDEEVENKEEEIEYDDG